MHVFLSAILFVGMYSIDTVACMPMKMRKEVLGSKVKWYLTQKNKDTWEPQVWDRR